MYSLFTQHVKLNVSLFDGSYDGTVRSAAYSSFAWKTVAECFSRSWTDVPRAPKDQTAVRKRQLRNERQLNDVLTCLWRLTMPILSKSFPCPLCSRHPWTRSWSQSGAAAVSRHTGSILRSGTRGQTDSSSHEEQSFPRRPGSQMGYRLRLVSPFSAGTRWLKMSPTLKKQSGDLVCAKRRRMNEETHKWITLINFNLCCSPDYSLDSMN